MLINSFFSSSTKFFLLLGMGSFASACPYGIAYPTCVYGFATDCGAGSYGTIVHETHPHLVDKRWRVNLENTDLDGHQPMISPKTEEASLRGSLPIVNVGRFQCNLAVLNSDCSTVREATCTSSDTEREGEISSCRMRINVQGFRPSEIDIGSPREKEHISPMGIDEMEAILPQDLFARTLKEMNGLDRPVDATPNSEMPL